MIGPGLTDQQIARAIERHELDPDDLELIGITYGPTVFLNVRHLELGVCQLVVPADVLDATPPPTQPSARLFRGAQEVR